MTMPTPEKIDAYAERLLDRAKALVDDPEDEAKRREYMRAAFNLDWTAAAIVHLALSSASMTTPLGGVAPGNSGMNPNTSEAK